MPWVKKGKYYATHTGGWLMSWNDAKPRKFTLCKQGVAEIIEHGTRAECLEAFNRAKKG